MLVPFFTLTSVAVPPLFALLVPPSRRVLRKNSHEALLIRRRPQMSHLISLNVGKKMPGTHSFYHSSQYLLFPSSLSVLPKRTDRPPTGQRPHRGLKSRAARLEAEKHRALDQRRRIAWSTTRPWRIGGWKQEAKAN